VIDDVHLIGRDEGRLFVLWTYFQVKESGGVFDQKCQFWVGRRGGRLIRCVKLGSMLF